MGVKDKDKSLLEIAVELFVTKDKPQPIMQIAKEAMETKGLKTAQAKELLPQFLLDFQASGYFVYCGDGCWDLKERQPTSVLDKDGTDYEIYADEDEVRKNELKDEFFDYDEHQDHSQDEDEESEEEDDIESALKESSDDGELENESDVDTGYEEEDDEEDY